MGQKVTRSELITFASVASAAFFMDRAMVTSQPLPENGNRDMRFSVLLVGIAALFVLAGLITAGAQNSTTNRLVRE